MIHSFYAIPKMCLYNAPESPRKAPRSRFTVFRDTFIVLNYTSSYMPLNLSLMHILFAQFFVRFHKYHSNLVLDRVDHAKKSDRLKYVSHRNAAVYLFIIVVELLNVLFTEMLLNLFRSFFLQVIPAKSFSYTSE